MRGANKLSALKVSKLTKVGRYSDGLGLYLQVADGGSKSWLFRFMRNGAARQMGLGPVHTVSLAEARERARVARQQVLDGGDPIEARKEQRMGRRLTAAKALTFKACAEQYIAAHESSWRNDKHRAQWKSTLANFAYPMFGELSVAAVDTVLVEAMLAPIWTTKRETAVRLRGRVEAILDWAKVRQYRDGENPARWRGHLDKLLAKTPKGRVHHPALPYPELAQFLTELRERDGVSARALEFMILTAARTGETIGAKWSEINFGRKIWTIPGSRMKSAREHRVPLSVRAIEVLTLLPREVGNDHVFIGLRVGSALSNMAMLELMRGMRPGYVPHGFRSTFRDWAAECTHHQSDVIEMALAHVVANKVEAAYRRGDLLEKRAELMVDWSIYCSTPSSTDNVVLLRVAAT